MSQSNSLPDEIIIGVHFEIHHCNGAMRSLERALEHVQKNKRASWLRNIKMQFKRLADGQRLSKENFPTEGLLPRKRGQSEDRHFKAIKKIPLRGYLWKSERFPNRYYVSHYVYKDYPRLKQKDTNLVGKNWLLIEEGDS